MRNPPRKTGKAAGISSRRSIWAREACREHINSFSALGTARMPTIVLTSTGKKTIKAQIRTFENMPAPNQMTSSGATATIGMAWLATRNGETMRSNKRDLAIR